MGKTIIIDGDIGDWWENLDSKSTLRRLNQDVDVVHVLLNTFGGSVFDGMAIKGYMEGVIPNVNVYGIGALMSAGTLLLVGGNKATMLETSILMMHNSSNYSHGDKDLHVSNAQMLQKIDEAAAKAYESKSKRTGKNKTAAEFLELMGKVTYMTAYEAQEWGLVDEVLERLPQGIIDQTVQNKLHVPDDLEMPKFYKDILNGKQKPQKKIAMNRQEALEMLQSNAFKITEMAGVKLKDVVAALEQTEQNDFVKKGDLPSLKGFAKKSDMGIYLKKDDLIGFAKTEDLQNTFFKLDAVQKELDVIKEASKATKLQHESLKSDYDKLVAQIADGKLGAGLKGIVGDEGFTKEEKPVSLKESMANVHKK